MFEKPRPLVGELRFGILKVCVNLESNEYLDSVISEIITKMEPWHVSTEIRKTLANPGLVINRTRCLSVPVVKTP